VVVCLSVSNFAQKLVNGFAWNFQLRLALGQWKMIKFWWQSGWRIRFATLVRHTLAEVCTVPVLQVPTFPCCVMNFHLSCHELSREWLIRASCFCLWPTELSKATCVNSYCRLLTLPFSPPFHDTAGIVSGVQPSLVTSFCFVSVSCTDEKWHKQSQSFMYISNLGYF